MNTVAKTATLEVQPDVPTVVMKMLSLPFHPKNTALLVLSLSLNSIQAGQRGDAFTFDGATAYLLNSHTADNSIAGLPIYRAGTYTRMWVKGAPQTARYLFCEGSTASNLAARIQ
jgi:hypothetical protein